MLDLIIIGAGAAGLGAARAAAAAGLTAQLIEAKSRTGGRVETRTLAGEPWDVGAHWLHSADRNPLAQAARAAGLALDQPTEPLFIHNTEGWAGPHARAAALAALEMTLEGLTQAGARGRDLSFAKLVDPASRWARFVKIWLASHNGTDLEDASTVDLTIYEDTPQTWIPQAGMADLLRRVAEPVDVPLTLGCRAQKVIFTQDGVRVETGLGALAARAVIITVSTAVLAERLVFEPRLPPELEGAIAGVPMGHAMRIGLAWARDPFGLPAHSHVLLDSNRALPFSFEICPFGRPQATAFIAGRAARTLERGDAPAAVAEALAQLRMIFGARLPDPLAAMASSWSGDGDIGGAYSAALPGHGDCRRRLAEVQVDGRLFLAGEACAGAQSTTLHGAWQSGCAAVARFVGGDGGKQHA